MHLLSEAARRSGVTPEAIGWLEREGVLPKPAQSAAGRRLYGEGDVARLRFLRRCRELGLPMAEVAALLRLRAAAAPAAEAGAIAAAARPSLRARIADLLALDAALGRLIEDCAAGGAGCPMLDPLFDEAEAPPAGA